MLDVVLALIPLAIGLGIAWLFQTPMITIALICFGVQWLAFLPSAFVIKSEKFYDLTGSLTFMLATATSLAHYFAIVVLGSVSIAELRSFLADPALHLVKRYDEPNLKEFQVIGELCAQSPALFERFSCVFQAIFMLHTRQIINSLLVLVWCARLGVFLFARIWQSGEDKRFERVRHRPAKFFVYWNMQGLWVFLTALPVFVLNASSAAVFTQNWELHAGQPNWQDYVGWALWLAGFLFESVADHQKSVFRAQPANKDKWIDSGLWGYSRHPNYFGEILLNIGLWISCASSFRGIEYLTIISPAFVAFLLINVSGIPLLEKRADKTWGKNEAYLSYKKRVPVLVPLLPFGRS